MSLLQIATPSRGTIEAYGKLQGELAKLVSDVNGRHGEVDWTPIRYLNKGYSQTVLAGLYRTAQVGVVTPLHDGMNLVAKEYVAAQNPADPGVLVLSKFAGAANELDTALLVNPHDIDGMARTIATALSMPLSERRMRWEAMMAKLRGSTIQRWFADFVDALRETRTARPRPSRRPPSRRRCGRCARSIPARGCIRIARTKCHGEARPASGRQISKINEVNQSVAEIAPRAAAVTCKKSSRPFKTGHPERWPSGLRRTLGKRVCGKPYRGFESHSLRHYVPLFGKSGHDTEANVGV